MKFEEQLNSMRRGERNAVLVQLMLRGLGEKMSPQEIINRIQAAHGDMTDAELRHAMQTAQAVKTDYIPSRGELRIARAIMTAERASQEDCDFVKSTIAKAASANSSDLMRRSPLDVSGATPREQALAYIATIFPDDRYMVFTANEESKFHKRTFDTLRFPSVLFRQIADGAEIPNYAIANQFSGMPDDFSAAIAGSDFDAFRFTGCGSFACTKTLSTRRMALLEFDALSLEDQARFWVSVIDGGLFGDKLRTLVFSGTKSIHALIRMDEPTSRMEWDGENYNEVYDEDPIARWKVERSKLSRITEHSAEERFRADKACKDPTRLTRFAGAVRVRKDGTKCVQRLLWCANPRESDIPIQNASGQFRFLTKDYGFNGEYYKC